MKRNAAAVDLYFLALYPTRCVLHKKSTIFNLLQNIGRPQEPITQCDQCDQCVQCDQSPRGWCTMSSVTSKKSPNVYKNCPRMISQDTFTKNWAIWAK